ncbi:MAG: hypothetical protein IPL39_10720 [Opitutaceae bacterium]|nr:hypothetical protein [Opitutaceae bacterium]
MPFRGASVKKVTPTSVRWGFHLGSAYIRKVAFRDHGMIIEISARW